MAEQLIEPRTANTEPQSTDSVYKAPGPARLMSLDALRGFDMFWIIGGQEFFTALAALTSVLHRCSMFLGKASISMT